MLILLLLACAPSPSDVPDHIAILGIPSRPVPEDWRILQMGLREIGRLAPEITFISADWEELRRKMSSPLWQSLQEILDSTGEGVYYVPPRNPDRQPRYYSLFHRNHLFLVLDSHDSTVANQISYHQIHWLQAQKRKAGSATFTAVLLDQPLWDREKYPGPNNWWSKIHPVLVELNVKVVIAGCQGHYQYDFHQDGIQYIQSAGASNHLMPRFEELGNFPHFLWLAVSRDDLNISAFPVGQLIPDSSVTKSQTVEAYTAYQSLLSHPDFPLPDHPRRFLKNTIPVTIQNPMPFPISGELTWVKQNRDWRIYPPRVPYSLLPGRSQQFLFNIWLISLRSLNRNLPVLRTEIPPEQGYPPRPVIRYLNPKRTMRMPLRTRPVTIDGDLSEWFGVVPIVLNQEYFTTGIPKWNKKDLSVAFYGAWDLEGLYLGVDVKDDKLFSSRDRFEIRKGDCVELALDGAYDRRVPGFDQNDHHFGFAFTGNGPVAWRWHGPEQYPTGRIYSCPFDIQRIPGHTIYEIFLPRQQLAPLAFRSGSKFGFTFVVHDNDGKGWKGAIQWTAGLIGEIYPALFGEVTLR